MSNIYSLAVIGAGASGLACAITHKTEYPDDSVVLIEKLPKVGKKILATGNGRCNLTNLNADASDYNKPGFVKSALSDYSPKSNIEFFNSLGLLTFADSEGRVYPRSNSATSVLNALRFECERLGIEFITETAVSKLVKKDHFIINDEIRAEKVIISCGGTASPSQGSDGSGYKLLESLGHKIINPKPSLVQLTTDTKYTKPLKGIRVKGKIRLEKDNLLIGESKGEILFTDYGLSGIACLDISMMYSKLKDTNGCYAVVDMADDYTEEELFRFIKAQALRNPAEETEKLLSCILPSVTGKIIIKYCGMKADISNNSLNNRNISEIVSAIKSFSLKITGTKGFNSAQVTSGGADTKEFNRNTLESIKVKNLYCSGEVLDIDSRCGGFNLQWAWSSGRLAGLTK